MMEFQGLAHFAGHLLALEASVALAEHHALKKVAVLVEKTAKEEIGVYQPEVGGFAAWAPLAPTTVADRVKKGFTPDDPLLRTGGLRGSISHQIDGHEAMIGSDSDVMVYQELGTPTIPPRPVLGPAAVRSKEAIEHIVGTIIGRAVAGISYGAEGAFVALPAE